VNTTFSRSSNTCSYIIKRACPSDISSSISVRKTNGFRGYQTASSATQERRVSPWLITDHKTKVCLSTEFIFRVWYHIPFTSRLRSITSATVLSFHCQCRSPFLEHQKQIIPSISINTHSNFSHIFAILVNICSFTPKINPRFKCMQSYISCLKSARSCYSVYILKFEACFEMAYSWCTWHCLLITRALIAKHFGSIMCWGFPRLPVLRLMLQLWNAAHGEIGQPFDAHVRCGVILFKVHHKNEDSLWCYPRSLEMSPINVAILPHLTSPTRVLSRMT